MVDFDPETEGERIEREKRHANAYAIWTKAYEETHAGDDSLLVDLVEGLVDEIGENGDVIRKRTE